MRETGGGPFMWPTLLGAGWIWGGLVAGAFMCFIVSVLGFLFAVTAKPLQRVSGGFDEAWHRYEDADLAESRRARMAAD